jgi:hypothetical protein
MKKNNAAYAILSPDGPVYSGSSIPFSSAVIRQDYHERLLLLNKNVTNFLNF